MISGSGVLAAVDWSTLFVSPTFWGLLLAVLAIWLAVPRSSVRRRTVGGVIGLVGLGLVGAGLPLAGTWLVQGIFWILALVTLFSAAAAISMQSAVYSAIWFALSLLGTAGLFFFQGAQFLGVATVVVYAGAIVVTFLFVIMLAQPEGHATYDRISWSWYAKPFSALAAASLVGILSVGLSASRQQLAEVDQRIMAETDPAQQRSGNVLQPEHTARMGGVLFGEHLISVEIAGTLLLVALVGAVAIMIQGHQGQLPEPTAGGLHRG